MADWNREISFGRKKQEQAPAAPVAGDAVPWWKKEIGGKKKEKPAVVAAPSAEKVPWWKKEIGGKKQAKQKAAAKAAPTPFWKKELGRKHAEQTPQPPAAASAPQPEPAVEAPAPEPAAVEEDYGWLTERLDPFVPPVVPADEPAAAWPPRSADAPVAAAWPPASDAPVAEPAPAPVPEHAPAPVAVAPAAPVAVPAAAVVPEQKVPFWKKELGKPKAARAPKPAKAPKPEAGEKVPFWKKELSLGKGKAAKAERAPKRPKPEAAEKVPFWKRELGKPKAPKAPKAEKPAKVAAAKAPFWKKELSLGGGGMSLPRPRPKARSAGVAAKRENAQLVGLKVGASQLVAARVHNNGSPQLLQVAREPLDDGVVVGGELRDVEALAEALKRLFGSNKLPKKGIRLGIANNRIGVRTFEISGIDDAKQLANAIRFRAQETLPIPLEEAVLDWQVLRETKDESGATTRRVLLVVAYRELVDRYVLACKKAGLRLEGIDLEAFAMLRALTVPAAADEAPLGAQVVVNVGHDRSTFAVTDGRTCEFTRVLAWGGQSLNVAIARALDATPSEAAPLKHAMSLVDDSVAIEGLDPQRAAAACAAVRNELQAFARELVSSLRFYQNQPSSLGIGELMLAGGTAALPGLAEELQSLVGVTVRVGDPLVRVTLGKRVSEEQEPSAAIAIGLGIED